MKILICCNKRDFFLTRICVASIRYYYPSPEVEIFILKDFLNGDFNSKELESLWDVKVLDLGIRNYGWSAAKMHFLFSNCFPGEKVLALDSDIVFAGRLLEPLYETAVNHDFTVNATFHDNPYDDWVPYHYYDFNYLKSVDPDFKFPGYFFNGGQVVVTTGKISQSEVIDYFDLGKFPYWKAKKHLPFVDQSLLNYIIPKKEQAGELTVGKVQFMIWSESEKCRNLSLEELKEGSSYKFVIHWAGALRIPYLSKMTRSDILSFFEDYYYSRIPAGRVKQRIRKIIPVLDYYLRKSYRSLKKLVKQFKK